MSKIVQASILPIKAKNVMIGRLFSEGPPVEIVADPNHPITRDLMHMLPKLTDEGLEQTRKYLLGRESSGMSSSSSKQDIESWIRMVDEETRYRKTEKKETFGTLLKIFTAKR